MTIWKYEIPWIGHLFRLEMPQGARILHVAKQGEGDYLWAEVDPNAPTEERKFAIVGTGHKVPPGGRYVGTWQDPPFVWHLFEGPEFSGGAQ